MTDTRKRRIITERLWLKNTKSEGAKMTDTKPGLMDFYFSEKQLGAIRKQQDYSSNFITIDGVRKQYTTCVPIGQPHHCLWDDMVFLGANSMKTAKHERSQT